MFVTTLDLKLAPKLRKDLEEQGFEISQPQYTVLMGKKTGISCTLYQSGKLTVQGKQSAEFIEFYIEPELLKNFTYTQKQLDETPRIGVDEAGKGDFFGPLCVAGVFAEGEQIQRLHEIGVKDSKNMADAKVLKLAAHIRKECAHHIVVINPAKYNELYPKFRNLNRLLAWGHATCLENLAETTGCQTAIIDQFAAEHVVETALSRKGLSLDLTQRTKGEEDIVVAAASILARAAFLEGLERLGKTVEITLPKGGGKQTIPVGKKLFAARGRKGLEVTAKMHFKNLDQIVAE